MKLIIVGVGLIFMCLTMEAKYMENYQGLKIELDADTFDETGEVIISGELSIFVKCGSQYSVWGQFPEIILYTLTDLDTGKSYKSIDNELSISWDGNEVYDRYAEEPCNKIVTEKFTEYLSRIYFDNPPKNAVVNFELQAHYLNYSSGSLIIKNAKVILKGF